MKPVKDYLPEVLLLAICLYGMAGPVIFLQKAYLVRLKTNHLNGAAFAGFLVYILMTSPFRIGRSLLLLVTSGAVSVILMLAGFFKFINKADSIHDHFLTLLPVLVAVAIKLSFEGLMNFFGPAIKEKVFIKIFRRLRDN